jgi:hypothetical protein
MTSASAYSTGEKSKKDEILSLHQEPLTLDPHKISYNESGRKLLSRPRLRDWVAIRHPGQIPLSGMRAGIQTNLISPDFPGFRVSPMIIRLARNDSSVELRHRPWIGNDFMECYIAFSETLLMYEKRVLTNVLWKIIL